jgi:hypothetical protein
LRDRAKRWGEKDAGEKFKDLAGRSIEDFKELNCKKQ